MAGAALYLASRAGAWVTGAIIPVDGGFLVNVRSFIETKVGRDATAAAAGAEASAVAADKSKAKL